MAISIPEQYQSLKTKLETIVKKTIIQYELTSSNYNPTINSTITITCTCKNVLGNPIANKTVELFQNGTSVGTATTNANGIATWTITCDNWGIQHFNVENKSIDVRVTGYIQTSANNGMYTIYEYEYRVGLRIHIPTDINFTNGIKIINNQHIPHRLAPRYPVMQVCVNGGQGTTANTAIGVSESNDLQHTEIIVKSLTGSDLSRNAYAYLEWDKKY